jgi:hypothetical protein
MVLKIFLPKQMEKKLAQGVKVDPRGRSCSLGVKVVPREYEGLRE